jgi:hypothetical protein
MFKKYFNMLNKNVHLVYVKMNDSKKQVIFVSLWEVL